MFSLARPKKLETSVRKTSEQPDVVCSMVLGRCKKHSGFYSRENGSWQCLHAKHHSSSLCCLKQTGHRERLGVRAWSSLLLHRQPTAGQEPWHNASPAELPAAHQSLHASLLAALFTSVGISHFAIPVPSSPGEGMRLPKKSLAWGRFAVIRNKHQPISSPAAKTTWSWHAGSFCPSRSPKKPAPG